MPESQEHCVPLVILGLPSKYCVAPIRLGYLRHCDTSIKLGISQGILHSPRGSCDPFPGNAVPPNRVSHPQRILGLFYQIGEFPRILTYFRQIKWAPQPVLGPSCLMGLSEGCVSLFGLEHLFPGCAPHSLGLGRNDQTPTCAGGSLYRRVSCT